MHKTAYKQGGLAHSWPNPLSFNFIDVMVTKHAILTINALSSGPYKTSIIHLYYMLPDGTLGILGHCSGVKSILFINNPM